MTSGPSTYLSSYDLSMKREVSYVPEKCEEIYVAPAFFKKFRKINRLFHSCGQFTLDDLTFAPVATAVPEPATGLLVGLGLIGLVSYGTCRSRWGAMRN